jgi:hypothetical protein
MYTKYMNLSKIFLFSHNFIIYKVGIFYTGSLGERNNYLENATVLIIYISFCLH